MAMLDMSKPEGSATLDSLLRGMEERDPDEQVHIDAAKRMVRDGRGRFRGFVSDSAHEGSDEYRLRAKVSRGAGSLFPAELSARLSQGVMNREFNVIPRDGVFVTWFKLDVVDPDAFERKVRGG